METIYLFSILVYTEPIVRFSVYKDADLMDFVNAPIGKGLPISQSLHPLIAVPTTAGTGSETTGTAILDITSRSFKTGIANRAMKPILGIVVSSALTEGKKIIPMSRTLTIRHPARLRYTSAQVLMSYSTVWKVILQSRE